MAQPTWWTLLITPVAALLGVLIGGGLTLFQSYRQNKIAEARERRQLELDLLRSELVPILDFIDRVAATAEKTRTEVIAAIVPGSRERHYNIQSEFDLLAIDGSVARARAHGVSPPIDDSLRELLNGVAQFNTLCTSIMTANQNAKQRDKLVSHVKPEIDSILKRCGHIRHSIRTLIIVRAELGPPPYNVF